MLRAGVFSLGRWRVLVLLLLVGIVVLFSKQSEYGNNGRTFLGLDAESVRSRLGGLSDVSKFQAETISPLPGSSEAHAFWQAYAEVLMGTNCSFPVVREKTDVTGWPMIDFKSITPWSDRVDRLNVTLQEKQELTAKHIYAREEFRDIAHGLPYVAGTRGVVMTTSVEAMGYFTVSLRMLRKTGTTLPVEVWIFDRQVFGIDPYGFTICEQVWKPLGAICKFIEDHLPSPRPPPLDVEPLKYGNKMLAMLFSSFEEFLFLDSDNFPIMPVDELFVNEPFASTGCVFWPDYWADTSSQHYYDIANLTAEGLMTRATTESGQIMMSKRTHGAALLLASFYVQYGPQYYFQLFSQAAIGMGDKEVYLKAVKVYNLPFYQVVEPPERLGYRCNNNEKALASGQHHPGDDFMITTKHIRHDWRMDLLQQGVVPRIQFIHANLPRLDPPRYVDWGSSDWPDQHRCSETSKPHRMYGHQRLTLLKFGWDVEKAIWDTMRWTACDAEKYMVQWWNGTFWNKFTPRKNTCQDMAALYDELFEQEDLTYDPSMKSPFDSNGEFFTRLKTNRVGKNSWENMRSPARWLYNVQQKDSSGLVYDYEAGTGYGV